MLEVISLDKIRAQQIMQSPESLQVLYQGSPVWLENINSNNTVKVTRLDSNDKIEVPVYMLVENTSVK